MANAFMIGKNEEVFTSEEAEKLNCYDWFERYPKRHKRSIKKRKLRKYCHCKYYDEYDNCDY